MFSWICTPFLHYSLSRSSKEFVTLPSNIQTTCSVSDVCASTRGIPQRFFEKTLLSLVPLILHCDFLFGLLRNRRTIGYICSRLRRGRSHTGRWGQWRGCAGRLRRLNDTRDVGRVILVSRRGHPALFVQGNCPYRVDLRGVAIRELNLPLPGSRIDAERSQGSLDRSGIQTWFIGNIRAATNHFCVTNSKRKPLPIQAGVLPGDFKPEPAY